jgi:uncharacterized protein (DUF3084 family)
MSAYTLFIVAALIVFGALAARLGDYLGYRIGRKRLSLFGLRPRVTGIWVGMVIGALVPLVTAGVAALASQHVRDALFRLDVIHKDVTQATSERDQARQAAQAARRESQEALAERNEAVTERDQAQVQAAQLRERLNDARARLCSVQAGFRLLSQRQAALSVKNAGLVRQLQDLQRKIQEAARKLDEAEKQTAEAERRQRDAESRRGQAEQKEQQVNDELAKARDELVAAQQKLADAETRIEQARAQLGELQKLAGEAIEKAVTTKELYAPGEELIRRRVRTDIAASRLEDELRQLLRTASEAAAELGAGLSDKNNRYVELGEPVIDAQGRWRLPSEEEVIKQLASSLDRAHVQTHVISVVARVRAFPREPVRVVFRAVPNRKVFSAGEIVASTPADGSLPLETVGAGIWMLLRREARLRAEQAGILPQPGEEGGRLSFRIEDLFRAASAVQEIGGPARVDVVAQEDTYVEGPLAVELRVEKAKKGQP